MGLAVISGRAAEDQATQTPPANAPRFTKTNVIIRLNQKCVCNISSTYFLIIVTAYIVNQMIIKELKLG